MKDIIQLHNRYYSNTYLQHIDKEFYQLHINEDALEYMRIGFGNTESGKPDYTTIEFIDPDGGPFISIGSQIDEYIIDSIITIKDKNKKCNYILKLKEMTNK